MERLKDQQLADLEKEVKTLKSRYIQDVSDTNTLLKELEAQLARQKLTLSNVQQFMPRQASRDAQPGLDAKMQRHEEMIQQFR